VHLPEQTSDCVITEDNTACFYHSLQYIFSIQCSLFAAISFLYSLGKMVDSECSLPEANNVLAEILCYTLVSSFTQILSLYLNSLSLISKGMLVC
jgi:hypothetical protein